jgi:acyl transferase domain-containing protein
MLSPHGRCYSFDSRANGFSRGEGVAALILKPLDAAVRDGDAIRAIIRGSCLSQDGRTTGITMPSQDAQVRMIRKAYEEAGLQMKDTFYVEAHGEVFLMLQ